MNEKPFYIINVIWGEAFRNYLLEYCLPSLLAPGNFPALRSGGHRLLFATTLEDWRVIQASPVVQALSRYAEPTFLEIPYPEPGVSGCVHMGIGHKLATARCFEDGAVGTLLTPDCLVSDGALAKLEALVDAGNEVVLTPAIRFTEEDLFAEMRAGGYDRIGVSRAETGTPLTIPPREVVRMAVPSIHSQCRAFEFEAAFFGEEMPTAPFWRVPHDGGIILHCLSWLAAALDYGAIREHSTTMLDETSIDGDYVFRNFGHQPKIHASRDSDEMMIISWAPREYCAKPMRPDPLRRNRFMLERINWRILKDAFNSEFFDDMKRGLFYEPARWHVHDIDEQWAPLEKRIARIIRREPDWIDGLVRLRTAARPETHVSRWVGAWRHTYRERLRPALRGDKELRRRALRRVLRFGQKDTGNQ